MNSRTLSLVLVVSMAMASQAKSEDHNLLRIDRALVNPQAELRKANKIVTSPEWDQHLEETLNSLHLTMVTMGAALCSFPIEQGVEEKVVIIATVKEEVTPSIREKFRKEVNGHGYLLVLEQII